MIIQFLISIIFVGEIKTILALKVIPLDALFICHYVKIA